MMNFRSYIFQIILKDFTIFDIEYAQELYTGIGIK